MYFVYILIDPRDNAIRYVGMTNDIYSRFAQHLRCDSNNISKNLWIGELKNLNKMVIMKTLEEAETIEQAKEREIFWIQHYHSKDLLNVAGVKSFTFSEFMAHFQGGENLEQEEEITTQIAVKQVISNGDAAKRIRNIVKRNPKLSPSDIARKVGVTRQYASRIKSQVLTDK